MRDRGSRDLGTHKENTLTPTWHWGLFNTVPTLAWGVMELT